MVRMFPFLIPMVDEPIELYTISSLDFMVDISFICPARTNRRSAASGNKTGIDFLSRRNLVIRNTNSIRNTHSVDVIPIFSIEERGSDEAISVRRSVSPVIKPRITARNCDRKWTGNVRGTSIPVMTTRDERGTIIIFEIINHVGNRLKSIIVRGSVPAWAMTVTVADC